MAAATSRLAKHVVVVAELSRHARDRLRPLVDAGFVLVDRQELDAPSTLIAPALDGAWATIAGAEPYGRTTFEQASGLRAIARWGAGVDAIDVDAATAHGVVVLRAPGANSEAVADCALLLMLACVRRLSAIDGAVRSGRWRALELTGDLTAATVGLVGVGAIGKAVAIRLAGFGCRVIAFDPAADLDFCSEHRIELMSFEELLTVSDIVSLHAPLTPATNRIIGQHELALMRRGSFLINTARGGLVDEDALIAALNDAHLAGAGLDVFAREPLAPDHPLTRMQNVVLMSHAATFTHLAVRRTADVVVHNLLELRAGRLPVGCINPEAW